jgi:sortase A
VEPSGHSSLVEQSRRRRGHWRWAEAAAWTLALVCLGAWGGLYVHRVAGASQDLERFAELQTAGPRPVAAPDLTLWDFERIVAWRSALEEDAPPPLAVLRIPKIHLEVAVLPGTDDFVLNRAVGHIDGTALPGTDGNSAIAGHRDGFFRGLKDVRPGDAIEVETLGGNEAYSIEQSWVVEPEDVWVLDATPVRSITLVTCYPFYYVGSAPHRFVVRAVLADHAVQPTGARRVPRWQRLAPQLAMHSVLWSSRAPSGAWRFANVGD